MAMRRLIFAVVGFALMLPACKKKVDPDYMKKIQDASAAICACVSLPAEKQVDCMGKAGSVNPSNAPGGDPPGIYEEKLDDASKSLIAAERAKYSSCEAKITQP